MEVSGRRAKESKESVNVCDNCMTQHSLSRAAFGYCVDCRDYLCEDCYHGHRDHRPSRNHQMLEKHHMPKERMNPVDICNIHADEKIMYFCKEHQALACQKCAFLTHRLCKNVSDIATLSCDPKQNQRYTDLTRKIAILESKADNNRQIRLQNQSKIDTNIKQAKADIKSFCKEMHEHLNKIESSVEKEVDAIGEEAKNKMDTVLQDCDSMSTELKVLTTDLETNQDPGRKNELFIAIEKAMVNIKTLEDKLTKLGNANTVREYAFEPNKRLKDIMADVKTLGQISIRTMATAVPSQSAKAKDKSPLDLNTATVETADDVNILTQADDNRCHITGITMMEGDTIVAIADYNNTSVKLVDVRQQRVVSQIHLTRPPFDITRVQPDQLAVTLPGPNKVQFLSVTGTSLSLARQMKVSGRCYGIDYSNDRLFISFTDSEQVQIINMTGSVLNTISAQTDKQIQFANPYYLTLSVDRSLLYVSDWGTHTVYCLDMNGKLKGKYTDQGLKRPHGVSAAEDGSLLVCGCNSHNLNVISSDCRQGRVLLDMSHGIQLPYSMLYNSALSTLYVGKQNSDTLKVFKLK